MGTKWGPQTIAKLVNNSNFTMVYGTYNYSYWGENQLITRGPYIVGMAIHETFGIRRFYGSENDSKNTMGIP